MAFHHGIGGYVGSEILYRKSSDKKFKVLLPGFANDHEIIRAENDKLYVRTNLDAPNYRVIRIDLNNPSVIEEIIPEIRRICLRSSANRATI